MIEEDRRMQTEDQTDWGPWRDVMEDVVQRCSWRVLQLERSMRGNIVLDRQSFRAAARALYFAADELVDRCDDVEASLLCQLESERGELGAR